MKPQAHHCRWPIQVSAGDRRLELHQPTRRLDLTRPRPRSRPIPCFIGPFASRFFFPVCSVRVVDKHMRASKRCSASGPTIVIHHASTTRRHTLHRLFKLERYDPNTRSTATRASQDAILTPRSNLVSSSCSAHTAPNDPKSCCLECAIHAQQSWLMQTQALIFRSRTLRKPPYSITA